MAYPKRLLSPDEEIIREFRPHWRAILMPISLTVLAIVALIVAVSVDVEWLATGDRRLWAVLAILASWALVTWPTLIKWWFTGYVITTERLVVRTGVFSRAGKEIPLEVINDVAFSQKFVERWFRSGDLLVESAGEQGQSRFHDIPDPEGLQSLIYKQREDRTRELRGTREIEGRDPTEQLESLARLHSEGVITTEEFESSKKKLLEDI